MAPPPVASSTCGRDQRAGAEGDRQIRYGWVRQRQPGPDAPGGAAEALPWGGGASHPRLFEGGGEE
jgi:hypothetical protein